MKLDRNKLLFIGLLISICGFIILYALQMGETSKDEEIRQPRVPELVEEPEEFSSKLEAVDASRTNANEQSPVCTGKSILIPPGPTTRNYRKNSAGVLWTASIGRDVLIMGRALTESLK